MHLQQKGAPDGATRRTRGALPTGLAEPAASAAMSVLWLLMATAHPTTTYHFAPFVAAAAWPVLRRLRVGARLSAVPAGVAVAGAAAFAVLTTMVLAVQGALHGPTLLDTHGAEIEALTGVALGAGAGTLVARWPTRPAGHAR